MSTTRRTDLTTMIYDLEVATTYYARLHMLNDLGQESYKASNSSASVISFTTTGSTGTPTVITNLNYEIFVFTDDAVFTAPATESVEVLLVGGGGAGGQGNWSGGGGGGGGVLHLTDVALTAGQEYEVLVGRGGFSKAGVALTENGGDTKFAGYIAYGGGAGGDFGATAAGKTGASGGGGGYDGGAAGTAMELEPMQGSDGGKANSLNGGGGGGATQPGVSASSGIAGDGGDGYDSNITGSWHCYGSGGGSGSCDNRRPLYGAGGKESGGNGYISALDSGRTAVDAQPGVDGLGGGGGGGGYPNAAGGRGGKGTVIIRRQWKMASLEPVLGGYTTNDITNAQCEFAVKVDDLGADASSADVTLRYGSAPDALDQVTEAVTITEPGTYEVSSGLAANTFYYAKIVVANDKGKSSETAVFSFRSCGNLFSAKGGDFRLLDNGYRIIGFTNVVEGGVLEVQNGGPVEILVVGGGGGGGCGIFGGGGGGGGVIHTNNYFIPAGNWPVTVGAGGAPGDYYNGADGQNGGDTSIYLLRAFGGGFGAKQGAKGGAGGSGGGSGTQFAAPGKAGQGTAGGLGVGVNLCGGGGATMPGANSTSTVMGNGGDGLDCDICGDWHCYGSGGGAGNNANGVEGRTASVGGKESGGAGAVCLGANTRNGVSGVDGLGGGGGGGGYYAGTYGTGGRGGSGCVILRYRTGGFMLMLR